MAAQGKKRPPLRSRQWRSLLAVGLALQVAMFLYFQMSIQHPGDAVLRNTLRDFKSSVSLNEQENTSSEKISLTRDRGGSISTSRGSKKKEDQSARVSSKQQFQKAQPKQPQNGPGFNPVPSNFTETTLPEIPQWLKEYILWHKEQRQDLTLENWNTTRRYIVMQCVEEDPNCGGTADRLKPIPVILRLAYEYKYILLIHWNRPCKLEEFLVPNNLDWRVPDWMSPLLGFRPVAHNGPELELRLQYNVTVARSRYQSYSGGQDFYQQRFPNEASFPSIYHSVWRAVFTPSPPVQRIISEKMQNMGLVPGNYVAAHLRALYAVKTRNDRVVKGWAFNAVKCASNLYPGDPIYFASDSKHAVDMVEQLALREHRNISVVQRSQQPLHLQKDRKWKSRHASEYYDTFVDLYLLGMSRCVAYNIGGYGTWARLLSYNVSCGFNHFEKRERIRKCDWADTPTKRNAPVIEDTPSEGNDKVGQGEQNGVNIQPAENDSKGGQNIEMSNNVTRVLLSEGEHAVDAVEYGQNEEAQSKGDGDTSVGDQPKEAPNSSVKVESNTFGAPSPNVTGTPEWVKEYITWHNQQRKNLNRKNWNVGRKYLVVQCMAAYKVCGGAADRLKPIPTILRLAHEHKRILLIRWERPAKLEEFLVPPANGFDWRVPEWMHGHLKIRPAAQGADLITNWLKRGDTVVRSKYQSGTGGEQFYDEHLRGPGEPSFRDIYHHVWRAVFTPAPPVAKIINDTMKSHGLVPGEYAAAHLRALYGATRRDPTMIEILAVNAVNCASQLRPGGPIYFASDSKHAADFVENYARRTLKNITVVTRDKDPLHIEKDENWRLREPSEFYDTFVDIYLLGLSRCVSHNIGGYGSWGLLMGYNAYCGSKHALPGPQEHGPLMKPCEWADASTRLEGRNLSIQSIRNENGGSKEKALGSELLPAENDKPREADVVEYSKADRLGITGFNLTALPDWLIEYMAWHKEQRKALNPKNWNVGRKYLVMQCMAEYKICGGTADRLKPIPTILRLAYEHKRILFIRWERPCRLEEFLVPPEGGLDWRVPDWLHGRLLSRPLARSSKDIVRFAERGDRVIRSKYQSGSGGENYYNEQLRAADEPSFRDIYHHVWRSVFTPSPPVAKIINDKMGELGLVPGEYSAAHLRALYAVDSRDDGTVGEWAINAINCASQLRPGGPVYFASDSKYATEFVQKHAIDTGRKISVVVREREPLHLEKEQGWEDRRPSDYYDTFVDLYLLGMSRCVAYNIGGFGSWGLLLGYNASCGFIHAKQGPVGQINRCARTD